jgi:hypothetical protein
MWINPPPNATGQAAAGPAIVTPDDPRHGVIDGRYSIVGDRSIALVNSVESLQ